MKTHDTLVQLRRPSRAALPVSRRSFLQLLGAGFSLAGLAGCTRSIPEAILPYDIAPEHLVPGQPREYATAMAIDGLATGLLVRSDEGRPTKIEGNPDHPASLGASGLLHQASLLQVYDPDRLEHARHGDGPSSWDVLLAELRRARDDRGAGLRLLGEPSGSPTLSRLLGAVRARYPMARSTLWSPVPALANTMAGAELALGQVCVPRHAFETAKVVVALDADFLGSMPFSLANARTWSWGRGPEDSMSRLYAVECALSPTGSMADHRLARPSTEVASIARAIASGLPGLGASLGEPPALDASAARFSAAVARDLARRPSGTTLVVVGERQPPLVHALGWAMNAALGNLGRTVEAQASPLLQGDQDLRALVAEMRAGAVDTLIILDGNPAYACPADLGFAAALGQVRERIYRAPYANETARRCTWVAPAAHYLESWGDERAYDGTVSIVQPLIEPLGDARTAIELVAALAGEEPSTARELVRRTHAEIDWARALQRGLLANSALPALELGSRPIRTTSLAQAIARDPTSTAFELDFYPSPTVHDGRYANNPWLLEQPEPMTKLTWENAVLVSPAVASAHHLENGDRVTIAWQGRSLSAPVLVSPGHADGAVSIWLGYGRQGAESIADGRGVDAYPLRTTQNLHFATGATLRKQRGRAALAITQSQDQQHGRPLALSLTLDRYRADPGFTRDQKGELPSLMPPVDQRGLQWAMSIDLGLCTGCSACMLACQAENNVLVVGKDEILRHRQMHWLRIDTYFAGPPRAPRLVHQPMMCQHCETAPCEYVCPVNATVHSPDGLNEMVYNRCVGTRFCSNNCPYKVRRFNWFDWNERVAANQGRYTLAHNPDVTVRERGVMEKCTYCVQRIRRGEIRAEIERRELRPGEVRTACQQACPTGAIEFGSLSHRDSAMVRRREQERSYAVLHDEGTRPRTMYLARVENPNPELA